MSRAAKRGGPLRGGLRRRISLVAATFGILTAAHVWGFGTDFHKDLTGSALGRSKVKWSERAVREIQDANLCVDLGSSLLSSEELDKPCVPGKICGECQLENGSWHFDDELLLEGSRRLRELRDSFATHVRNGHFTEARKVLGYALHSLQDFYSHSNWVELGNKDKTFGALIDLDAYRKAGGPYTAQRPAISRPDIDATKAPMCFGTVRRSMGYALYDFVLSPIARALEPGETGPGTDLRVLTTGYFHVNLDNRTPTGKCAHSFPKTIKGIDKDDSSRPGHHDAYRLAWMHSIEFINDALGQLEGPLDQYQELYDPREPGESRFFLVPAARRTPVGKVKAGEVYEFRADPDGERQRIVWGRTGLFGLGNPIACGPDGTPGVDPSNHSMWVTPPLPNENVGALIGIIFEEDCTPGSQEKPCNALDAFLIGRGVRMPMPASGQLFLQVNDGVLANNSGYFKVAVKFPGGPTSPRGSTAAAPMGSIPAGE